MRRIIKDIKFNGNTQYRVETNKIFFIIVFYYYYYNIYYIE